MSDFLRDRLTMGALKASPARMSMARLTAPSETLEAQFNPTELEEKISVNYDELAVLGLSHMPLQYSQTGNLVLPFELAFRVFDDRGNRQDDLAYARRFLYSLCFPSRTAADVTSGAPPRVLFVWPTLLTITAVVTELSWKHTLFNKSGTPIHSAAKITVKQIRDVRMFSEDVLAVGMR